MTALWTVKELIDDGEDKIWAEDPNETLTPLEKMAWYAAEELAALLEMSIEIAWIPTVAPESVRTLFDLQEYFNLIGQPVPCSMALIMLRMLRHEAGLVD